MMKLLRRLRYAIFNRRLEAELAEEIESHRAMLEDRVGAAESRRALGNVTLAREDARDMWIWPSLERLGQDLRFGARLLKKQPMFAATAILTMAVGIGATTTVFSVVEAELWRPLPFPDAHRLVALYTTGGHRRRGISYRRLSSSTGDPRATPSRTWPRFVGARGMSSAGATARSPCADCR